MKKIFVSLLLSMVAIGSHANPDLYEPIDFSVGIVSNNNGGGVFNPGFGGSTRPRLPMQTPQVFLDGHFLTFTTELPNYTLYLIDEKDNSIVYSADLSTTNGSLNLPVTLTGNYIIVLFDSEASYYYYAYIYI